MKLWLRRLVGVVSKILFPYSYCMRCYRTWNICKEHTTFVESGTESNTVLPYESHDFLFHLVPNERRDFKFGVFPLCESCWSELVPEQRISYYKDLYFKWENYRIYSWETLKAAVLSE